MEAGDRLARTGLLLAMASFAGFFSTESANAQTNERAYESLEFRVVTPGARAVAMGKTFVGIADDATAAASNPAGLSNLLDPEVSVELTGSNIRTTRMVAIDPLRTQTFTSFVGFPTFASYVTPLPDVRLLRDMTVAVFYNSLQRYKENFDVPDVVEGRRTTEGGYFGSTHISGDAAGVGGAFLVTNKVSVGGSLTVQHLSIESNAYSGNKPFVRNGTVTHDRDFKVGGQLGALVKPSSRLSIGAAFYSGTTFRVNTTIVGVFSPENSPPLPPIPIGEIKTARIQSPEQTVDYRIPDRFTVGTAIHPTRSLTVLADVAFVGYAQRITPNFLIVDFLAQEQSAGLEPSDYFLRNVAELHTGLEYRRFRNGRLLAFRTGLFTDPDHQMRFDYEHSSRSPQANGQRVRFNSLEPGTVVGVTGGAGFVLRNYLQFDLAISWSANAREVVVSSVARFPR